MPHRVQIEENMTDVLLPNQPFDIRSSEYPLVNADWFFSPSQLNPATTLPPRSTSEDLVLASSFQHTSDNSTSPPSRCASNTSGTPFYSDSFKGIESSMSQNNPFEDPTSNPAAQPTLYSNVRPSNSNPSTPESVPRSFASIAPDPAGLQRMQAIRQNQEYEEANEQRNKKRRLTSSSMDAPPPPPLRDEDKLLLQLKDEQSLPWKDIAARFQTETGKVHMIPALQMRYKRLKERLQVWTDPDVDALKQAHEYWESKKFEIISSKMLEYGASEKFSARACQKKWQDLHPTQDYMQPLHLVHSAGSVHSSMYGSNPASPQGRGPMPQFSVHGPMPGNFSGSPHSGHLHALYTQAPTSVPTHYSASSSNSSLPGQQGACQSYSTTPVSAVASPFPQQQQQIQQVQQQIQQQQNNATMSTLQSPFLEQPQPQQSTNFPAPLATPGMPGMQESRFLAMQTGQQQFQPQQGNEKKFVPSPQHSATFPPVSAAGADFWQ